MTDRPRIERAGPTDGSGRGILAKWWPYALVGLLAVLPFLTGLGNGFVFDDQGLVIDNPAVWSPSVWEPWTSRYWPNSDSAGLYRPLTTFSFWLDGQLYGQVPRGFLVTNLLLHLVVSLLVLSTLRALFPQRGGAVLTAALIFAIHPLHSEAVVGIVGRAELWAALGALAAYRLGLRYLGYPGYLGYPRSIAHPGHHGNEATASSAQGGATAAAGPSGSSAPALLGLSAVALLAGLLAKESAIGLLVVLGFHLVADHGPADDGRPRSRRPIFVLGAAWGSAVALTLLARIRVLGDLVALGPVSRMDNVLAHVGAGDRILTALFVQARAVFQLVWPRDLSPDYSYPQIVPTTLHSVIGGAFGLAALIVLVWALRRSDRELLWGWVFAFATGVLTSNLVFPIGTVYGERLVYLPSAGTIWLLVVLGSRLFGRLPRRGGVPTPVTAVLVGLALVGLGIRSAVRAPDWKTNITLFEAASRTVPNSAKVWTNLGLARIKEGELEAGLTAADRALTLDPEYAAALQAKGSVLIQLGRPSEAIPLLEKNRNMVGKRGLEAVLELGNAQLALGDGTRALNEFTEARSRSTETDERWMVGLGSAYALQSRWPESVRYWQNAVSMKPEDPAFRQRYAFVLWQNGQSDEAEAIYRRLLDESPRDPDRMNELAWFLAVTNRGAEEALRTAEAAYDLRPGPNVADTWLEAWLQARGCTPARAWLRETGDRFPAETRGALEAKLSQRCGPPGAED